METTEQKILNMIKLYQIQNLKGMRDSLHYVIKVNGDLINSIHDAMIKFDSWEVYVETLIIKILFASNSVVDLSNGSEFKTIKNPKSAHILDLSSIYILSRAVIENFVTLDYIYFNKLPKDEQLFRFRLWEVSGLISRQDVPIKVLKGFEKKRLIEKQRIFEIKKELKAHKLYSTLKNHQIWKLDKYGLPRLKGWQELINESKLKKIFFKIHMDYFPIMHIQSIYLLCN